MFWLKLIIVPREYLNVIIWINLEIWTAWQDFILYIIITLILN